MTVSIVSSTTPLHEETIMVAELWGQNVAVDVGSVHPTDAIIPQFGRARKHIFRSIKQILKQRQLAYIDVLQYYISDSNEPLAETMRALNDVVEAGYVHYVVVSSCYGWQLRTMRIYGVANRLTPFISFREWSGSVWVEGEQNVSPKLDAFANEFTPSRGSLQGTIVFESLA